MVTMMIRKLCAAKLQLGFARQCCSISNRLVDIVSSGVGGLQEMEDSLDRLGVKVTPSLVTHVITSSSRNGGGGSSSSRRLLRFFSWCRRNSSEELGDEVFNRAIRAFSEMKDITAVEIAMLDLQKAGRKVDRETFAHVAETLVNLGRPEKAVSLFRDIEEKQRLRWRDAEGDDDVGGWSSVTAAVHALCAKGHARKAQGILWHHKDKVKTEAEVQHHRSLILHGWAVHGNAKEVRRIMEEMKSSGNHPSLASYHDLLRCVCKRNLKFNPSALVPEATNVMTEMRSSGISPTTVSFNILLSCLGKTRRVKEACRIIFSMMQGEEGEEATPDSVSYYLVIRLLYLTGRFGRGNKLLNRMIEAEDKGMMMPRAKPRFYHDLIGVLCGTGNVEHALKTFERMKKRCCYCQVDEDKPINNANLGPTYDMLIAKLCRNGKFDLGRHLWDDANEQGVTLRCSSDLLEPLKAPQVFHPTKKTSKEKISAVKSTKRVVVQKHKKSAINISKTKRIKGKKRH
nr:pentatricopeptide repeat protein AaPPR1186 [Agave angustifolia]